MSVSCCWYVLVLLTLSHRPTLSSNFVEERTQIEKPKEFLRHQQTHRPSFIDRKLIDNARMEVRPVVPFSESPAESESGSERNDRQADRSSNDEETEVPTRKSKVETSIEKPTTQIRHSRSRNHFARQPKIEGLDLSYLPGKRIQLVDNASRAADVYVGSNNQDVAMLDIEESTGSQDRSDRETTGAWIDERSAMELDKFLPVISGRTVGGPPLQRRRNDSFDEPRKVVARNKPRAIPGSRSAENLTEIYGRIVHGAAGNNGNGNDYDNDNDPESSGGENAGSEDYDVSSENAGGMGKNVSFESGDYDDSGKPMADNVKAEKETVQVDIVTRFLRIIENQHLLGENCTAGTDLNLGEGVVDQYAQERFRLEANLAVNRANMLTRLWKYAPQVMLSSEYLLHASILSMVEFDEDIFAAGNCYDKLQYKDRWLYCPFAHRLQDQDGILVKDLAIEYKYLSNSSEWFYIARKNAERVIASNEQFSRGFHTYTLNESTHTNREEDEILTVKYEDGRWSKPYYDCGGGNIWMLTYTVPFFGYVNDTYFFKGTSGIDIDLRRVDIDQCPLPPGSTQLNIFSASDKCKKRTTECVAISGLGFRRGSYRCVCKRGFYYPDTKSNSRYYNGTVIEEEFEKLMMGEESQYDVEGVFECLPCAEGCEFCEDGSPCVVSLNWLMRTAILILECCVIACLPAVALFTWKYGNVKVVRAASPVLLRVIVLGAFFIYCTTIVMYPRPNVVTCTVRVWLREIGFSLTYGALMLKTWRISVIFRVKSAKAVKITDASLLKRLGIILMIFSVFLGIRTLVAPPVVIVARTADDLKAYLCRTDWWDHSFTILEVIFLMWGIRLCIVVRKTPSEFNESRFISMAIYNEFLLSVFLNVSMLFLQSPANPDLLYIIFFCHTQLTVTLLLCLIFGSKAYVVFRGGGKDEAGKLSGATGKFLGKSSRPTGTSNQTNSISLQQGNFTDESDGATEEFRRLINQLEVLKEKNVLLGNHRLANKLAAMQDAANRGESQVPTIQTISSSMRLNDLNGSTAIVETDVGGSYQTDTDQGNEAKEEEKCRACVAKNGIGDKERPGSSREDEILVYKESKDARRTDGRTNDAAVSTSARPATEDVGTETSPEERGKEREGQKEREKETRDKCKSKSGHARTHAIVINLDDKTRFSEEVTV